MGTLWIQRKASRLGGASKTPFTRRRRESNSTSSTTSDSHSQSITSWELVSSPNLTPVSTRTSVDVQRRKYPWSAKSLLLLPPLLLPRPAESWVAGWRSPSPFPRSGHALAATPVGKGDLLFFGGYVNGFPTNDLYIFTGRHCTTALVETTGDIPTPRSGSASALFGAVLFVWGGDTRPALQSGRRRRRYSGIPDKIEDTLDQDLYCLNIVTCDWTRLSTYGPCPVGRFGHTVSMIGSKAFIFGGQFDGIYMNDLWAFDLASPSMNPQWTLYEPLGSDRPPHRSGHSCVQFGDFMIIFGGTNGRVRFNDTWSFNLRTRRWFELSKCSGLLPRPRDGHAAAVVGDVMYIFGGRGEDGDLAALNISEQRWYIFDNMGITPPNRRSGHGMAAIGPKIYVLGGRCSPQDENTIHVLDTRYIRFPKFISSPESPLSVHVHWQCE